MHRVVRADIAEPVWDEFKGIVVMPTPYTEAEAAAAMLVLVRERRDRGPLPEAPLGTVAR